MRKILIVVLLASLLSSCTMPQTKIYSVSLADDMRKIPSGTGAVSNATVVVAVRFPRYLSQSYIAHRSSPFQLEISRYSRWDTPPSDTVREAFKSMLESSGLFREVRASGFEVEGSHFLEINLRRFEKYQAGENASGDLSFNVTLRSPQGRELYIKEYSKTVQLEDKSNLALAKGLSRALSEGLEEVRTGLIRAMNPGG
ncbi:MAG: membrane integrity-associated transporter subunit PqiC [Nitrospirae bacterium]|nr:membrane integrity-associated transporter subunit PqiC [Nitrospirota bacterium]